MLGGGGSVENALRVADMITVDTTYLGRAL